MIKLNTRQLKNSEAILRRITDAVAPTDGILDPAAIATALWKSLAVMYRVGTVRTVPLHQFLDDAEQAWRFTYGS